MNHTTAIPTARIEAFSDGVIAIIITVMVFDLKLQAIPTDSNIWHELSALLPRFISYIVSFMLVAIMWVSHHQLFHQIKHTDRRLPWYNIHLLFWMSLVPFGTNFIGNNPMLPAASFFYGMIFFMNALSFTLLRQYVINKNILHEGISVKAHEKITRKNRAALTLYFLAALSGFVSVYVSFILFIIVPAMYFIPEKIVYEKQHHI